ncbi:capsular polysaccharide biosynthesis protein [Caballeronia novacaledonica]|uniref:Capsular polysaccharide biosynthesis protein n=1 Tax=Caballeronia novacaledonica TaxID=1544861 RepID=A0A2U3I623_9BURK|nr:capsular polysaccharide biosynthesis protein [Caballeronia novacaledonica]
MSGATAAMLAALAASAGALIPDAIAKPRASLRRSGCAFALHVSVCAFVCFCMLAASGRLFFSMGVTVLLAGALAVISNAKYESLREPFLFTDLSLFSQLFAHPRLYLPFLTPGKIVALALGAVSFAAAWLAEAPLAPRPIASALLLACLCLISCCLLGARLPLSLSPVEDQRRHGFLVVFVAYLVNGLRPATVRALQRALAAGPFAAARTTQTHPDVIVIQSESFFDARVLHPSIRTTLLAHFDRACEEAALHGELDVPAWGANTMRSEFAVLSGLDQTRLGYARFYPYAFLRRASASLVSWFARSGYRTLAIHPYHADFFGRDRAYRHLGFDRFMDIEAFAHARRAGAYVSDEAVTDAIIGALDDHGAPAFIFAVTMENHGPLHLERVTPGESAAFHGLGDESDARALTAYLRHLVHADAMLGRLLGYLRARKRETVVCFYGDHVPAMPRVYRLVGCEPGTSRFLVWRNFGTRSGATKHLRADELGLAVIDAMSGGHARERTTRKAPAEEVQEHE